MNINLSSDENEKFTDNNTQITVLKDIVKEFCEQRDWDQFHNPKDLAIGIITEASELLEIFRFKTPEDIEQMLNDPDKRKDIADELADVFYFVLRFSQKYNFDLSSEFIRKMGENDTKYPTDKCRGSNKKYSEA